MSIDTSTDFPNAPEGETGDSGSASLPAGHFAPDGAYMAWLARDLATAAADPAVRWIVAGGHRPFEDFDGTDVGELFKASGVSMYFAGHGHRWGPVVAGLGHMFAVLLVSSALYFTVCRLLA